MNPKLLPPVPLVVLQGQMFDDADTASSVWSDVSTLRSVAEKAAREEALYARAYEATDDESGAKAAHARAAERLAVLAIGLRAVEADAAATVQGLLRSLHVDVPQHGGNS